MVSRSLPASLAPRSVHMRVIRQEMRDDEPLFLSTNGKPLTPSVSQGLIWAPGECAGVPDLHPHRLRNSFALDDRCTSARCCRDGSFLA